MSSGLAVSGELEPASMEEYGVYLAGYRNLLKEADLQALGASPQGPTGAKPGSVEKVTMLAARYAAGLPLWHGNDCYDHGPGHIFGQDEDD